MARRSAPDRINNFSQAQPDAKFVGAHVSIAFHKKLQEAANSKNISLAAYLRESLAREIYSPRQEAR